MSGSISFIPDVGSSQVFNTVTNVIAQTLVRADAVYAAAKANLEEIKNMVDNGYNVAGIDGGVASKIGINSDTYMQSGQIPNIAGSITVDVSMPDIDKPQELTLGEITNNIAFDGDVQFPETNIVEPSQPISYFENVANTIVSLRPIGNALDTIETDVVIDSVVKPDVSFVLPVVPDLPPLDDIPKPEFTFSYNEPFYTSELGSYLYNMLLSELQNGSTGLTATVESDIYSRESERDSLELQNTKDKIANIWAESGLSLPDGVLVSALAAAELDYQNKYSDKSRDVRIESFKRADDNAKFVKDLTVKYEQILMGYMAEYWARQLDAAKAVITYMAALYDAILKYHTIFNERYKAQVEGYKATIDGQSSELEAKAKVYLGEIQYVSAKADTEIKSISMDLEVQKNKISKDQVDTAKYDSDIRFGGLYAEQYKLDTDWYKTLYTSRIANLEIQLKSLEEYIRYESGKADIETKRVGLDVEIQKAKIDAKQLEIAVFDNEVKYEIAKADVDIKEISAKLEREKTVAAVHQANVASSDVDVRYRIGKLNALLESTKQEIDMMKISVEAAIAATSNIAQVSSTMVAGALSSLNANASLGASESQSASEQSSTSKSESKQQSSSINYNHNYSDS